jgi:hypothetical protein
MGREPLLDLFAERLVTNAGFVEKHRTLCGLKLQCGLKKLIELLPAFRSHFSKK